MLDFEFHPEAETEYLAATRWYDEVRDGLGDRFVGEIERAIRRAQKQPLLGRTLSRRTHRCLARTFPYGVVFAVCDRRIVIVAVMHLHRDPNYWKHRLKDLPK